MSSRAVSGSVSRCCFNSGSADYPSEPELKSRETHGNGSKNGHLQRPVAEDTHFKRARARPTPKATAKARAAKVPGRTSGHGCERSPKLSKTMPRRPSRPWRSRACLTAFFVRFAPLPSSSAKPSGTRASRGRTCCANAHQILKYLRP